MAVREGRRSEVGMPTLFAGLGLKPFSQTHFALLLAMCAGNDCDAHGGHV